MSGKIYELPPMLSGAGEQRAEQLRAFLIRMTMELNEQSEGARGERGEKGERGERGERGPQGERGAPGINAAEDMEAIPNSKILKLFQ